MKNSCPTQCSAKGRFFQRTHQIIPSHAGLFFQQPTMKIQMINAVQKRKSVRMTLHFFIEKNHALRRDSMTQNDRTDDIRTRKRARRESRNNFQSNPLGMKHAADHHVFHGIGNATDHVTPGSVPFPGRRCIRVKRGFGNKAHCETTQNISRTRCVRRGGAHAAVTQGSRVVRMVVKSVDQAKQSPHINVRIVIAFQKKIKILTVGKNTKSVVGFACQIGIRVSACEQNPVTRHFVADVTSFDEKNRHVVRDLSTPCLTHGFLSRLTMVAAGQNENHDVHLVRRITGKASLSAWQSSIGRFF